MGSVCHLFTGPHQACAVALDRFGVGADAGRIHLRSTGELEQPLLGLVVAQQRRYRPWLFVREVGQLTTSSRYRFNPWSHSETFWLP